MVTQDDHNEVGGGIEVNPHTLHAFGTSLGDEIHKDVKPHAQRLTIVFSDGVTFGSRNPSTDLRAAAIAYHDCLAGVNQQLIAVVGAVAALADSAVTIATRYASADSLAQLKTSDVQRAFDSVAAARAQSALIQNPSSGYE